MCQFESDCYAYTTDCLHCTYHLSCSMFNSDKKVLVMERLTVSRMMDINVRMKRTRNCVKQLVANVRHSTSQQS